MFLQILANVFHLNAPAFVVHEEGLAATLGRNLFEAGLGDTEPGAVRDGFHAKGDERGRLL